MILCNLKECKNKNKLFKNKEFNISDLKRCEICESKNIFKNNKIVQETYNTISSKYAEWFNKEMIRKSK